MHEGDHQTLKLLTQNDGGFGGGGSGIWAILLIALLGGGRGGLFGGKDGGCEAAAGIASANARFTGIESSLDQLERGQATAATIAAINGVAGEIRAITPAMNTGFVTLGQQITSGFNAVTVQATANTTAILSKLCEMEKDSLAQRLAAAEALAVANAGKVSNLEQTHHLEHFFRREMDDRFNRCVGEVRSAVASGNSAAGVASGNGSNNTYYDIQLQNLLRSLGTQVKA